MLSDAQEVVPTTATESACINELMNLVCSQFDDYVYEYCDMNTLPPITSNETDSVQIGSLHEIKSPCTRDLQQSNAYQMNKPKEITIVERSDQKEISASNTEFEKVSGVPSEDFKVCVIAKKGSQDISIEPNSISQEVSMANESDITTSTESEMNRSNPMENCKINTEAAHMTNESENTTSIEPEANSNCPKENSKPNTEAAHMTNESEYTTRIEPEASCNSHMEDSTASNAAAPAGNSTTSHMVDSTTSNEAAPMMNEPENSTGCCESANGNMKGKTLHD